MGHGDGPEESRSGEQVLSKVSYDVSDAEPDPHAALWNNGSHSLTGGAHPTRFKIVTDGPAPVADPETQKNHENNKASIVQMKPLREKVMDDGFLASVPAYLSCMAERFGLAGYSQSADDSPIVDQATDAAFAAIRAAEIEAAAEVTRNGTAEQQTSKPPPRCADPKEEPTAELNPALFVCADETKKDEFTSQFGVDATLALLWGIFTAFSCAMLLNVNWVWKKDAQRGSLRSNGSRFSALGWWSLYAMRHEIIGCAVHFHGLCPAAAEWLIALDAFQLAMLLKCVLRSHLMYGVVTERQREILFNGKCFFAKSFGMSWSTARGLRQTINHAEWVTKARYLALIAGGWATGLFKGLQVITFVGDRLGKQGPAPQACRGARAPVCLFEGQGHG